MKLEELMNCSIEEIQAKFEENIERNKYRHDMAVLFGSLGVSPDRYTSFMKTLDEIEKFQRD